VVPSRDPSAFTVRSSFEVSPHFTDVEMEFGPTMPLYLMSTLIDLLNLLLIDLDLTFELVLRLLRKCCYEIHADSV